MRELLLTAAFATACSAPGVEYRDLPAQQNYLKASNTAMQDGFGRGFAFADDGATVAVGAPGEDNEAQGIDPPQDMRSSFSTNIGAVYIFR